MGPRRLVVSLFMANSMKFTMTVFSELYLLVNGGD